VRYNRSDIPDSAVSLHMIGREVREIGNLVSLSASLANLDSLSLTTVKATMSLPFCLPLRWKKSVNYKLGKRKSVSITQSTPNRFRIGLVQKTGPSSRENQASKQTNPWEWAKWCEDR